jgi:hypothetical protein
MRRHHQPLPVAAIGDVSAPRRAAAAADRFEPGRTRRPVAGTRDGAGFPAGYRLPGRPARRVGDPR